METAESVAGFIAVETGIEKRGGNAGGIELVDLILHQGDERRNHDGHSGPRERRNLETQGFATARWKQGEDIAPG